MSDTRGDPMPEKEEWEVNRKKAFWLKLGLSEFDIKTQNILEE